MKHKTVIKAFDVIEMVLLLTAGVFILKVLFGFSEGMQAWAELDTLLRGY